MTVQERLRALISALPSDDAIVAFTRADLVRLLGHEADAIRASERDMTVEEIAEMVGRACSTIRGWLIAGDLRGYKLNGKSWRVPRSALREYLDAQTSSQGHAKETVQAVDISAWRRLR